MSVDHLPSNNVHNLLGDVAAEFPADPYCSANAFITTSLSGASLPCDTVCPDVNESINLPSVISRSLARIDALKSNAAQREYLSYCRRISTGKLTSRGKRRDPRCCSIGPALADPPQGHNHDIVNVMNEHLRKSPIFNVLFSPCRRECLKLPPDFEPAASANIAGFIAIITLDTLAQTHLKMAGKPDSTKKETMKNKNVMTGPLWQFSRDPPTGFYRDGYCRTGPEDTGNHVIAATVSDEFLDFSAKNGNNLRDVGVKGGMKWCLCTSRWKEAMEAAQKGSLAESAVPKVHIHATDESALKMVSLSDLKRYKADAEAPNQTNRQDSHIDPGMSKTSNTANNHDSRGDQRGGHENGMRG